MNNNKTSFVKPFSFLRGFFIEHTYSSMIVINKSDSIIKLRVTLSEVNPITTGSTLELKNQFNNVNTTIVLPNDTSNFPERFNLFELPKSLFENYLVGTYSFIIKDSNGGITETGLLKIIDNSIDDKSDFVYIAPNNEQDDFITYQQ